MEHVKELTRALGAECVCTSKEDYPTCAQLLITGQTVTGGLMSYWDAVMEELGR